MRSIAFANSLAAATGLFALALFALRFITPGLFALIFNSQFFGADVASLLPAHTSVVSVFAAFVIVVITAWIFGLIWAIFYNWWTNGRG